MRTRRALTLVGILAGACLAIAMGAIVAAVDFVPTTTTMVSVEPVVAELHQPVTFTAQVLPSGAFRTNVSFRVDNSQVGVVVIGADGIATLTVPEVPGTGPHTVLARYEGAEPYEVSESEPIPFTVVDSRSPIAVTIDPMASPVVRGDPVTLRASLDPIPVDGTISFRWSGIPMLSDVPLSPGGIASAEASLPMLGTWPITACYRGSATYQETCSAPVEVEVVAIPTTTTISIEPTVIYPDEAFTLSVDVEPVPPEGTLARMWPAPQFALDASGHAEISYTPDDAFLVPLGAHDVSVQFAGTTRLAGSSSNVVQVTVRRDLATLDLSVTEGAMAGDPVTFTAHVTPAGTGYDVGVSLSSPPGIGILERVDIPMGPDGSGSVTVDTRHWATGTWTLQADWGPGVRWIPVRIERDWVLSDLVPPIVSRVDVGQGVGVGVALVLAIECDDLGGSPVTTFGISNDGKTWTERPAVLGGFTWSLPYGDGTHVIHTRCEDQAGNWSAAVTQTVIVDAGYARATEVTARPQRSLAVTSGRLPIRLTWDAPADEPGIAGYRVQQRVDGGSWATVQPLAAASAQTTGPGGHAYRFRVQAVDTAGNRGRWTTQPLSLRLRAWQETSDHVRFTGAWRVRAGDAWGGQTMRAVQGGATATLAASVRSIAWVSRRGPGMGTATVLVDGVVVATIDLSSPTTAGPQVVWSRAWATTGRHRVTIRVGEAKVEVDGFYALR